MKKYKLLENFIFLCIILVLVQTFLEDFSVVRSWSVDKRNILIISGFVFDLIFSIEFVVRSIANGVNRKFTDYFVNRRGWVDFLSSFPLLFLNSGPSLLIFLTGVNTVSLAGFGIMNALKVVKAIRVTRILRLIRIIKIFGKIHNTESAMAQHHTSVITTISVFSIILTLIMFSVLFVNPYSQIMNDKADHYKKIADTILETDQDTILTVKENARLHFKNQKDLLRVVYNEEDLIPYNEELAFEYHNFEDILVVKHKNFEFHFSLLGIHAKTAFQQLQNFFIIIVLVLAFSFVYTRHFAQSISDVMHIVNKGLRKKEYNLQVKIDERYEDHAVYKIARFYNEAYLPAKIKKVNTKKELSLKDMMNFKG